MNAISRRNFVAGAGIMGMSAVLGGCTKKDESKEVGAVEDLMREHGVIRRALFVYSESAARIRAQQLPVPSEPLIKTAGLFRAFGEDYHEIRLEEVYIFPAVRKAGGEASKYVDVLIEQHKRGREITDYLLTVLKANKLNKNNAAMFASLLESFVRMYRPHAAREDTVVFPAWKQALTAKQLDEMNDKFEDIERKLFGKDGFENAVREMGEIESEMGLNELSRFTAQSPPPNT